MSRSCGGPCPRVRGAVVERTGGGPGPGEEDAGPPGGRGAGDGLPCAFWWTCRVGEGWWSGGCECPAVLVI